MARLGLTRDAIEAIKNDTILQGHIASAIGVSTQSLYRILKDNDIRLTCYSPLVILRKQMKASKMMDLLEEVNTDQLESEDKATSNFS